MRINRKMPLICNAHRRRTIVDRFTSHSIAVQGSGSVLVTEEAARAVTGRHARKHNRRQRNSVQSGSRGIEPLQHQDPVPLPQVDLLQNTPKAATSRPVIVYVSLPVVLAGADGLQVSTHVWHAPVVHGDLTVCS